MMRPSDFILNSDYLSIAQVSSKTYSVTMAGGTLVATGYTEQNFDFAAKAQVGASDRAMISKDGGRYYLGSYRQLNPAGTIYGFIRVYRTSATNIRAQVVLENLSGSSASYPAMTFSIKVSSFAPPNVF